MQSNKVSRFMEPIVRIKFMEEISQHWCPGCTDDGCPEHDALVRSIKDGEKRFNERNRVSSGA